MLITIFTKFNLHLVHTASSHKRVPSYTRPSQISVNPLNPFHLTRNVDSTTISHKALERGGWKKDFYPVLWNHVNNNLRELGALVVSSQTRVPVGPFVGPNVFMDYWWVEVARLTRIHPTISNRPPTSSIIT